MAKLVSGRVEKVSSASVSADRYQFLSLQEAEPDLGIPQSDGQVLASNTDGQRFFVTLNTNNVTEADNLYYTNDRVAAYLENAGTPLSIGDLFIAGNLVVEGDTTTLNTATLVVEDKNIILANGAPDAAAANGAGITIDGAQANITYNASEQRFDFNKSIYSAYYRIGGAGAFGSDIGSIGYNGNIVTLGGYEGVRIESGPGEFSPYWDFDTTGNLIAPGNITATTLISDSIRFNTSAGIEVSEGEIAWNSSDGTLDIGLQYGDVVLQVGQETHYVVRNATGETIENGTAVYCDGVTVGSGRIQANLMLGDGSIDPVQFLGLATHDITSGVNGVVTYFGYVRGLDTRGTANTAISVGDEDWSVGDKLYVHPTAAGKLTKVEPEAPNTKICVAVVINRHQSVGTLFVRPTTNLRLTKLSDVQIANVESNQFLVYDNNRWENITVDTDNILEGDNLYYTNARVQAYLDETSVSGVDLSGNTTTDLAEGDNLYYTNARVDSRISETSINVLADILITDLQDEDSLVYDAASGKFINVPINEAIAANLAELVLNLSLNDTDQLQEGSNNLYFTSERVLNTIQAGRGITISSSGLISSVDDSADFNLLLDTGAGYLVTDQMANAFVFPSPVTTDTRYIVRTIQVTNITDDVVLFSSNVILTGENAVMAHLVPVPVGGSIEMLNRAQAFNRNDTIQMQGFFANGDPASGVLSASIAYETVSSGPGLFSNGTIISSADTDILVSNAGPTYAVIESIKLINAGDENSTGRIIWTDANDVVQSYFCYNLSLPVNTSVEVLTGTKKINRGDKIYARTNSTNPVSVIVSGRLGDVTSLNDYDPVIASGLSSTIYYETELPDGTTIYYSIE